MLRHVSVFLYGTVWYDAHNTLTVTIQGRVGNLTQFLRNEFDN